MTNDFQSRSQFLRTEVAMVRIMMALAVALLAVAPVAADELDKEFGAIAGKTPQAVLKSGGPQTNSASTPSLKDQSDAKTAWMKGSELDDESPTQAYRAGWGGGRGRGWGGWGRGWSGGWGGGWGGWWGRGWGWNRGWGWGGWGWPYYASIWRPYVGYGLG